MNLPTEELQDQDMSPKGEVESRLAACKGKSPERSYDNIQAPLQPGVGDPSADERTTATDTMLRDENRMGYIPTWEELDEMSAKIKRMYALRSMLYEIEQRRGKTVLRESEGSRTDHGSMDPRYSPAAEPEISPSLLKLLLSAHARPKLGASNAGLPPTPKSPANLDEYEREHESISERGHGKEHEQEPKLEPKRDPFLPTNPAESKSEIKDIVMEFRLMAQAFSYPSRLDFLTGRRSDVPPLANTYHNWHFIEYRRQLITLMRRLESEVPVFGNRDVYRALTKAMDLIDCEICNLSAFESRLWAKFLRKQYKKKYRGSLRRWLTSIGERLVRSRI